jgi:hypothetical protein
MTDLNNPQPDSITSHHTNTNDPTKSKLVSTTSTLDILNLVHGDKDDNQLNNNNIPTFTSASRTNSPITSGDVTGRSNAISGPSSISSPPPPPAPAPAPPPPPTQTAHNVPVTVEGHTTPGGKVRCGGCKEVIDQSSGGVVVQFG